ncbi:MAG: alpha-2-macroglobulin family protein, partial [Saprospiraceae bacterium]|nr:alpha-2-macroglobulin family protein [Saprospiraceae bacterium]
EQLAVYYNFDKLFENFSVIGSNGVVYITTKSSILIPEEEENNIFKINGLQYPAAFPEFHPNQVGKDLHQPFFRPQLYWNPKVETDDKGQAALTFFQSDDISTFRIEVVAQSEDGSIGIGRKEYVVSWK